MALGNKLRFISKVLYKLKRDYGSRVDLYHQVSETVDLTTGVKTVTKEKITVKRAILLPTVIRSNFAYDLAYIAANKNFTYGGIFSTDTRDIIIDRGDIKNFTFDDYKNIYIIIDGRRYEITEYKELDYKSAYHLKIKVTQGAQLSQIVDAKIHDRIVASDETESTL